MSVREQRRPPASSPIIIHELHPQNPQQNQMILSSETLLIVEQLLTDLMKNQQQNEISLLRETVLLKEQLFTDLL